MIYLSPLVTHLILFGLLSVVGVAVVVLIRRSPGGVK